MDSMYDVIVVGCGFAGAVTARILADSGKKVLVIDKRDHIAGNMFEYLNDDGILIHKYGPHITVFDDEEVFSFLSKFTLWKSYEHTVLADIDGVMVPLPINYLSIDKMYGKDDADHLKKELANEFGDGSLVPILKLRESKNTLIQQFANTIFEKVFLHYTSKMWDLTPDEVDPAVTARIPIRLSYDCRHFLCKYQVMPYGGYNRLFENLLNSPNIKCVLNVDSKDIISLDQENKCIRFKNEVFSGKCVYTGALDYLFDYVYGELPYRSLDFVIESYNMDYIQDSPVLNWPDKRKATRRTEMKRLSGQYYPGKTATLTEYPGAYNKNGEKWNEPYYPILTEDCIKLYEKYRNMIEEYKSIYITGRLAEYKYYNMEATVRQAIDVANNMLKNWR